MSTFEKRLSFSHVLNCSLDKIVALAWCKRYGTYGPFSIVAIVEIAAGTRNSKVSSMGHQRRMARGPNL